MWCRIYYALLAENAWALGAAFLHNLAPAGKILRAMSPKSIITWARVPVGAVQYHSIAWILSKLRSLQSLSLQRT